MFKKILVFFCVCMMLTLQLNGFVSAQAGVTVKMDGKVIVFEDQGPVIKNGYTMVPMSGIFKVLGATVKWNAATRTVTAVKGEITISLEIGNTTAYKQGQKLTMDVPAQLLNGRTMVPLKFVSEAMGATVGWNASTKTVAISMKSEEQNASDSSEHPPKSDENK